MPPCSGTRVPTTALPTQLRALFPWSHLNPMQSECYEAAFLSDASLIVAAPTGSGKTGVLSLALARLWALNEHPRATAIYVAPLKALVNERFLDWSTKCAGLGIRCVQLTGDDEDASEEHSVASADLILTTPEKWDSFT